MSIQHSSKSARLESLQSDEHAQSMRLGNSTKAFDKVHHYALYIKLIDRNVPLCFLHLITYGYANCPATVRWGTAAMAYSVALVVNSDVK